MFSLSGFNHATILVSDKTVAEAFYVGKLGFKKHLVNGKYLWVDVGNRQYIHLTREPESPIKGSFYHAAINVRNLSQFISYLLEKDVIVFLLDEKGNRVPLTAGVVTNHVFVKDPDGNLVEFTDAEDPFFNPIEI
jgi:catechol 2,3-dioxygenase-like lactoylglutathione lyase family enzyme